MCKSVNGDMSVEHFKTTGDKVAPVYMDSSYPSLGFSHIKTSLANNVLTCSFTRAKVVSNMTDYFDVSKKFHILTASGSVLGGFLNFESILLIRLIKVIHFLLHIKEICCIILCEQQLRTSFNCCRQLSREYKKQKSLQRLPHHLLPQLLRQQLLLQQLEPQQLHLLPQLNRLLKVQRQSQV